MIVGADHRVRNAFRATLIDEPSSPSIVLATQEIDASDVLEVTDLAHAIARAEEVIRTNRSSSAALSPGPESSGVRDIFDSLGAPSTPRMPPASTDDCAGPAVHVPYRPTPIPQPPQARPTPIPVPPASAVPAFPQMRLPLLGQNVLHGASVDLPSAARTAPILVLDEDAFYHPAGRIRGFADVTIEGYRPEATAMVRLRGRRNTLSWIVVAVLAPLVLLALFAVALNVGRARTERVAEPTTMKPTLALPTAAAAPVTAAPVATQATPITTTPAPAVPVFDVKSLKSAPPSKPRR